MAGAVGLREVRYGYEGDNHLGMRPRTTSNPYFTFDPGQVHRLLALRARLRGGPGHLRADHRRPRLRLARSRPGMDEDFLDSECVSCGACVQACPTATLQEKSVDRDRPARAFRGHHLRLLRRRLHLQGGDAAASEVVRMVPYKDGKANRGHSCVKGRFAWGYATHQDRILKPMIREQIDRSLARGDLGRGDRLRRRPSSSASRRATAAASIGGITSSRCTNEETFLVQKLVRAGLRQQQRRYLRARLPLADRLRPEDHLRHLGRHPGLRLASRTADVILVIGANPTDGHPVFASRMKKPPAPGREADRHRPAPDRPRAHRRTSRPTTTCRCGPAPTSRC